MNYQELKYLSLSELLSILRLEDLANPTTKLEVLLDGREQPLFILSMLTDLVNGRVSLIVGEEKIQSWDAFLDRNNIDTTVLLKIHPETNGKTST